MASNLLQVDWGDALAPLFQQPQRTAQIQLIAEQIKASQLKRAQDEEQLFGARNVVRKQNDVFNNMLPPATTLMDYPGFSIEGDPSGGVPFTPGNAGVGLGMKMTPPEPVSLNMPREWGADEPFYRQRELDRSRQNLAPFLAKSPKDIAELSGLDALTQLNLYGVPQGKPMQDIMQTQLHTVGGQLPQYGTQPTPHNYTFTDPSGQRQVGVTVDAKTDARTGAVLPPTAQLMGPLTGDVKGPVANSEQQLDTINRAVNELATKGSVSNPRDVAMALALQYPQSQKIITDAAGNHFPILDGKAVPQVFGAVTDHINQALYPNQPPQQAAPAAPPQQMTLPPVNIPLPPAGAPPIVPQGSVPQPSPVPEGFRTRGPATAAQTQTAQRLSTASTQRQQLEQMIGVDPQTGQIPADAYVPPFVPAALNSMISGDNPLGELALKQIDPQAAEYYQIAMRWVEPVIRSASGAAISPREYGDYYRMYIPSYGDSPSMIIRKLNAMRQWETATAQGGTAAGALDIMERIARQTNDMRTLQNVQTLRTRAVEHNTLNEPIANDAAQQPLPPPKIGDVVEGHTYQGGDPRDPSSWR